MKKLIIATLLFGSCCSSSAQNGQYSKWKFVSANQVGLLQGESHTALSLQSVNGLRRGHVFAGVGTGLDYYRYRSVPLFAEGSIYPGKMSNQYYLYANAGTSFVWQERQTYSGVKEIYHPGLFAGAGIGYQAALKNGTAFTISAGYSGKKIVNEQQHISSCPLMGTCILSPETFRYNLNRIIVQLGWIF